MDYIDHLLVKADPYFDLYDKASNSLYMRRWWLVKPQNVNEWGTRLHATYRSDAERDYHDHPWPNSSQILKGHVIEQLPKDQRQPPEADATEFYTRDLFPGDIVTRSASERHRLIIPEGSGPVWSIFTMGGYERKWGFHSQSLNRWVYWREYMNDWTTETLTDTVEDAVFARDQQSCQDSQ